MGLGVPAGATIPPLVDTVISGYPASANVGTQGAAANRCALEIPRIRKGSPLPAEANPADGK